MMSSGMPLLASNDKLYKFYTAGGGTSFELHLNDEGNNELSQIILLSGPAAGQQVFNSGIQLLVAGEVHLIE